MKTRTVILIAGLIAAGYAIWKLTSGQPVAAKGNGADELTGDLNTKRIPIRFWRPPTPVGPQNPPRLPPVVIPDPLDIPPGPPQLDVFVMQEQLYGANYGEASGTNVVKGPTPFQPRGPLQWLNPSHQG